MYFMLTTNKFLKLMIVILIFSLFTSCKNEMETNNKKSIKIEKNGVSEQEIVLFDTSNSNGKHNITGVPEIEPEEEKDEEQDKTSDKKADLTNTVSSDEQSITGIPEYEPEEEQSEVPDKKADLTDTASSDEKQNITGIPENEPEEEQNEASDKKTDLTDAASSDEKQNITGIPEIEPEEEQDEVSDKKTDLTDTASSDEKQNITQALSMSILERDLDKKLFSLIDDRLFIQMPLGTEDIARQQGIMSAGRSNQEETRFVLEENGQQMVVFAQETFLYSEDAENDVNQIIESWYDENDPYSTECINESSDGFKVIKISQDMLNTNSETVVVSQAFVKNSDNTLIYIGVYVTPETAKEKELCTKQADRILESIQPGSRKIAVSAHEETIGDNISIQLGQNFLLVKQFGIDFSVYYIVKITKLGEFIPSIGIYVGGHPTMMYAGRGIDNSQLTKTTDTILDKNVDWLSYKLSPNEDYYCAETVLILPGDYMKMHIFIDTANEEEFNEIKKMIDSMVFR